MSRRWRRVRRTRRLSLRRSGWNLESRHFAMTPSSPWAFTAWMIWLSVPAELSFSTDAHFCREFKRAFGGAAARLATAAC